MIVYDEYGKPILHQLYLAYPNKNYIGKINFIRNYQPTFKFYSQGAHSIELDIYEKLNSNINPIYDQIEVKLLVEVIGIGWFTIISCDEQSEGLDNYKHISLESYETFLLGKQLDDINGVFALYDVTDVEHSILHICAKYSGWTIGHVDNDLIGKFRTFTLDSDNIYNFLMGDVSSSFKCIFKFNTYEKTINAYLPEHLGDDTDIFISNRNILQKYNRSSKSDKIVTKLKVKGGTGSNGIQLDIRDINPDGSNELINLDYYLPMMSEGLRNAWIAYQAKYNDYLTGFNTLINSWKNKTQEKIVLDSELKTLEMNRDTQDEIVKSYIYTNPTINSSTIGYQNYLNALNSYNSYVTLVANKKNQISNKETEINNVKIQIDDFQSTLTTGNFTQTQLNELEMFLTEGDVYEDSTFTVTDTMNEKDIIDMQSELRNNASVELYAASRPQYEISIEASNLYSIVDDISRKLSYNKWKQQLVVGNFITVKLNEYSVITLRVLEISLDYTSIDKMNIILSTKSKTDENEINVLLNNAHKTSGVVSLSKYGYDQASKISSEVREFMNSTLDATKNKVMSNPNAEFEVTPYGAMMRYYDESQKKYSDYQSMWSGYNLLFSSDGFKTAKAGIGLFVDPVGGFTYYGIIADVIVGQLVVGEKLKLSGSGAELDLSANNAITGLSAEFNVSIGGLTTNFNNQIDGLSSQLTQTAGSLQTQITDNKSSLQSQITQTAGSLQTQITDNKSSLQSQITQQAGLISSKVSSTDYNGNTIVSKINQSSTKIEQSAINIDLTGYVTFNSLSSPGQTTINGANLQTGTVVADSVKSNWVYTGGINANQITAGTITGITISTTGLELSGNNIKLVRGSGRIIDSAGKSMLYADSSGNIFISDYTSPASRINMYANEINLNPNELNIVTSTNSGDVEIGVFGSGNLRITPSLSSLTNYTEVGLKAPTINLTSSGIINIASTTKIGMIGKNITFRKTSSDTEYSLYDLLTPTRIYADSIYYASLTVNREFIPNIPSTSSTECSLGSSTYSWKNLYIRNNIYHTSSSGRIGVFGATPTTKKTISTITSPSTVTLQALAEKMNEVINANKSYGWN